VIGQLGMIGLAPGLPAAVRARIELLRERARAGLAVTCGGVSMEPAIARGDVVMVRSGWPRTGDVAAFVTRGGQLELHRLLAHAPLVGWWVHGGDNQVAPDLGLVHRAQLVGVAVGYWRAPGLATRARAVLRLARAAARGAAPQPR
jgi:hypothetical protein